MNGAETTNPPTAQERGPEPLSKIIDVRRGGSTESWLIADGRIEYHVENDGYRFLRCGPEAHDEWIDINHVKAHWPQLLPAVENAILELGAVT